MEINHRSSDRPMKRRGINSPRAGLLALHLGRLSAMEKLKAASADPETAIELPPEDDTPPPASIRPQGLPSTPTGSRAPQQMPSYSSQGSIPSLPLRRSSSRRAPSIPESLNPQPAERVETPHTSLKRRQSIRRAFKEAPAFKAAHKEVFKKNSGDEQSF
eukprot:Blabericola_migrator_1__1233@NODE_1316_length_4835_cov_118_803482_g886_i0_p3_GENE_NODE_1316_length_4835_cov_118_803482_g886_i0NODE_1316_length_4835_cov_118_803482_g886_i0_p3_ORF_typecomplete_len160_score31_79_NODE_1316_length_4835_cov_118_803482_g886_i0143622